MIPSADFLVPGWRIPLVLFALFFFLALPAAVEAQTPNFSFVSKTNTTATLKLENYPADQGWWYKETYPGGNCTAVDAGTTTVTVTGLTKNTSYTFRAYSASGCVSADNIGVVHMKTTPVNALYADDVKQTTATLRLTDPPGTLSWWYKRTAGPGAPSSCNSAGAAGTETVDLTGLSGNGAYTYAAHRTDQCTGEVDRIDTISFTTPDLTASQIGPAYATLTVSNHSGKWWHKKTSPASPAGTCVAANTSKASLNDLLASTTYNWAAYSAADCPSGKKFASRDFTTTAAVKPPTPTQPGLNVTAGDRSVTLKASLPHHGGSPVTKWKYIKKEDSNDWETNWTEISVASRTLSHTVSSLTNGTAYKFKVRAVNAVGDGAVSSESVSVTPATTPPAPSKPSVAAGNGSVTLSGSSVTGTGGSAITKWQYAYKSKPSGGNYGSWGGWNDITGTSTTMPSKTVSSLTNGTEYKFKVRAVNAKGDGAESSESSAVTPATTPPAPSKPSVAAGDKSVTLSGSSVTGTGGSAITKWQYAYKSKPSGGNYGSWGDWEDITGTSTTMPSKTISSLTNGTEYKFKVRAVNAKGDGGDSPESDAVTPATTPPAPSKPSVAAGNGSVTLSGSSVTGTGGSAITKWQYAYKSKPSGGNYGSWGGWNDITGTSTTMPSKTVSSLTNGTEYKFKVRAVNAKGDGAESSESSAVTPATTPPAPSKPSVAAGDKSVTLSGSSVTGTGGSAITKWQYAYKSKPSGGNYGSWGDWEDITGTSTTMPSKTISSLTNGTEYKFKVRAVNAKGDGGDSPESDAVTPATTPPAPSKPSVAAGNGSVTLSGSSVTGTGGSAITKWQYAYKSKPSGGNYGSWGDWEDITGTSTTMPSKTISSLTNGTEYKFKVRAVNAKGDGGDSPESDAVTPATTPPAPSKPSVAAGDKSVTLSGSSVTGTGGSAITKWQYAYKSKPSGGNYGSWGDWEDITGTSTTIPSKTVSSLTNGTEYKFKVRAVNAKGDGGDSPESDAVTPTPAPVLSITNRTATGATLNLANHDAAWHYKANKAPDNSCKGPVSGGTATKAVTGLSPTTSYTYTAYDDGNCSNPLDAAPAFTTLPDTPSKPSVAAGNKSIALSGASAGSGTTVTKWQYAYRSKPSGGNYGDWGDWNDIAGTSTTMPSTTVSGLTNGTEYKFKVRAVNGTDSGAASPESNAVTPATTPAKPDKPTVSGANGQVTLSWTAGSNGGSAITGWKYTRKVGDDWDDDWTAVPNSGADTSSYTVPNLTNGTAYKFKVRAVNANGDGAESDESDAVTPATTPAKPTGLTVSGGNGQVTLSWTAGSNGGSAITGWKYIKHSSNAWDSSWTAVPNSGADTTSYTVPNLTNGTAYKFKVRAVNANGDGVGVGRVRRSDAGHRAGRAVETCRGGAGLGSKHAARRAVLDPGQRRRLGGYPLAVRLQDDGELRQLDRHSEQRANTTRYTVTGLTGGVAHRFKLRAWNSVGAGAESPESDEVTPLRRRGGGTPLPPDREPSFTLTAGAVIDTTATLTIAGHTGDWWYKYTAPAGGSCSANAVSGASVDLRDLSSNTNYTFNAYGDSGCTKELASEDLLTRPGKPTGVTAAAGAGSGRLTLSASVSGSGALTNWQYRQKAATDADFGAWTDISSTSTT